jgi:hypothetical protein
MTVLKTNIPAVYFSFLIFISCTKDKGLKPKEVPVCEPSYTQEIQPMVLSKCATTGCHVPGFPFGDFTNYAGLKAKVDNGRVNTVIESKVMPPAYSPQLTDEELTHLKCWISNGAPEN